MLHRCDTPACCNPEHLFLGTAADNVADMVAKGRQARGDRVAARLRPERVPRGDRHWSKSKPESILRGTRHPAAKLTQAQVREIRQRHAADGMTHRQIASLYGVSRELIGLIVRGLIWRDALSPH